MERVCKVFKAMHRRLEQAEFCMVLTLRQKGSTAFGAACLKAKDERICPLHCRGDRALAMAAERVLALLESIAELALIRHEQFRCNGWGGRTSVGSEIAQTKIAFMADCLDTGCCQLGNAPR